MGTILIRFTFQLKFIYSICQTMYSWPWRASRWPLRRRKSRNPAMPVRLQDFSTSPANHRKKALSKNHAVVFVEDLSIRNMSKSESGNQENHGTNVQQKSGLDRETPTNSLLSGTEGSQGMAETPAVLFNASPRLSPPAPAVDRSRRYTRILLILFLCTLPLVNPIVHGDGVGYYAYVRAPLIEHNFDFAHNYQHAIGAIF